jgi:hypothetical protein
MLGKRFLLSKYTQPLLSNASANSSHENDLSIKMNGIFYAVRAEML